MTTCNHTWTADGKRVSCEREAIISIGWFVFKESYCEKHAIDHTPINTYQ